MLVSRSVSKDHFSASSVTFDTLIWSSGAKRLLRRSKLCKGQSCVKPRSTQGTGPSTVVVGTHRWAALSRSCALLAKLARTVTAEMRTTAGLAMVILCFVTVFPLNRGGLPSCEGRPHESTHQT